MWLLDATNSVQFKGSTVAVLFFDDPDFVGRQNVFLMARASPAVEWQVTETLAGGEFVTQTAGGIQPWAQHIWDKVTQAAGITKAMPTSIPTTWPEVKAWFIANLQVPSGSDVRWGPTHFWLGVRVELGENKQTGELEVRCNHGDGRWHRAVWID